MQQIGDALAAADRNIRFDGGDLLTKRGYTLVPNFLLNDSKLSSSAKLVYVMLLKYAWEKDYCFPGQATLAKDIGKSERHVHSAIKELEANRLLSVTRRGQGKSNIYVLHLRVDKRPVYKS
jgi:biotin operon repressor